MTYRQFTHPFFASLTKNHFWEVSLDGTATDVTVW